MTRAGSRSRTGFAPPSGDPWPRAVRDEPDGGVRPHLPDAGLARDRTQLAAVPSTHPSRQKFLDRVNFFGQVAEFDPQGRVLIQPRLRDTALMTGEVDVLGQQNFLEVWNHDRFLARLAAQPFSDDDARALAEFGI